VEHKVDYPRSHHTLFEISSSYYDSIVREISDAYRSATYRQTLPSRRQRSGYVLSETQRTNVLSAYSEILRANDLLEHLLYHCVGGSANDLVLAYWNDKIIEVLEHHWACHLNLLLPSHPGLTYSALYAAWRDDPEKQHL
jgi:hypothetical protein